MPIDMSRYELALLKIPLTTWMINSKPHRMHVYFCNSMINKASKRLPKLTKIMLQEKRLIALFGAFLLLLLVPIERVDARIDSLKTVVIDAGHGGNDPGAIGNNIREKDITLKLALKLGALIKESCPGVKVIYTRTTDVFVELYRRAQIANNAKADLFISLHCNAAKSSSAYGTETFVMGLHKSAASLEVARKENASILFEDNYEIQYDGFDPNSAESYALFSLFQNAFIDQSLSLAAMIESQFKDLGRYDRGVKQAGFLVLWRTSMPSVLIEAGFLSNPTEGKYLSTEAGQNNIAKGIFKAFLSYKAEVDKMAGEYSASGNTQTPKDNVSAAGDSKENKESTPANPGPTTNGIDQGSANDPEVFIAVQFFTSADMKPSNDPLFKNLEGVWYYKHNELYKYVVGKETNLQRAVELQTQVQDKGFKDAFLVAFNKGKRIPVTEATSLINK